MARTRGTIWLRPVRLRPCIREDGERSLGKQIAATRTCPAPSAGRAAMKADRILGHRDEQPSPLIQPPAISGISLRRSCCSTARCASMDPKRSQHGFRSSNTWNGRSPAHDRLATDRKWWTIRELQLIYQLQDAILVLAPENSRQHALDGPHPFGLVSNHPSSRSRFSALQARTPAGHAPDRRTIPAGRRYPSGATQAADRAHL